tara:strand:- start:2174 stop:2602 length:429 start_codon:yes stop_codon:yes gene_type:complete
MYDTFETDGNLEQNGVWLDYGDFRMLIASAGQGNKNYVRYAEKKLKPVRRAMEAGALSNERSMALMADIYSKTIVLDWQVRNADGEWEQGIEDKEGNIIAFNQENVEDAFRNLPRLFMDVQEQAQSLSNFRRAELEDETKNS